MSSKNGCPPVEIRGGTVNGGTIKLKCGISSQFLSALLLIAPCTIKGVETHVVEGPVSKPYIDMTLEVMETFDITIDRSGYDLTGRDRMRLSLTVRRQDIFGRPPQFPVQR
jgi:3-phosphoshikimate 1-carboxyvinyltransferase